MVGDGHGDMVNVVIVGAGPAGITAARELKAAGLDVLIVDGSSRIGGRVLSSLESDDPEIRSFSKMSGE